MEPYLHFHIRLVGLAVTWVFKGKFHVFFCRRTCLIGITKYKDVENTDCCVGKHLTTVRKVIMSGDTTLRIMSGDTTLRIMSGDTTLHIMSGDTTLPIMSGDTTLRIMSGDTTLLIMSGDTTLHIMSGDKTLRIMSGDTTLRFMSGDTTLRILKLGTRFWGSCKLPITAALLSVEVIRIANG